MRESALGGGHLRDGKCSLCHLCICCPLNKQQQIKDACESGAPFCCWSGNTFYFLHEEQCREWRGEVQFLRKAKKDGNICAINPKSEVEGSGYHQLEVTFKNLKGDNEKRTVTYGFWDERVRDGVAELIEKEHQEDIPVMLPQIVRDLRRQHPCPYELQSVMRDGNGNICKCNNCGMNELCPFNVPMQLAMGLNREYLSCWILIWDCCNNDGQFKVLYSDNPDEEREYKKSLKKFRALQVKGKLQEIHGNKRLCVNFGEHNFELPLLELGVSGKSGVTSRRILLVFKSKVCRNKACKYIKTGSFRSKEVDMTIEEISHRASEVRGCAIHCRCFCTETICPNLVEKQMSCAVAEKATLIIWDFCNRHDACRLMDGTDQNHVCQVLENVIRDCENQIIDKIFRRGSFAFESSEFFFLEIAVGGGCGGYLKSDYLVCAFTSKLVRNKGEEHLRRLVKLDKLG